MPVRTFMVGLAEGWNEAFNALDQQVEDALANAEIYAVEDMLLPRLPDGWQLGNKGEQCIARRVVYR